MGNLDNALTIPSADTILLLCFVQILALQMHSKEFLKKVFYLLLFLFFVFFFQLLIAGEVKELYIEYGLHKIAQACWPW